MKWATCEPWKYRSYDWTHVNDHFKHVFFPFCSMVFFAYSLFFSKSNYLCWRDWRQKITCSLGDGKMTMLTLPAFATFVSKWLGLSRDAAKKQLLYPGSLYSNLKRIMTLPRRLQIKWHKPWCCCSSLIYTPIQDLEWFFFSLQEISYFTGNYMCTTEHRQTCNHWLSHLEIPIVLLHQLGF